MANGKHEFWKSAAVQRKFENNHGIDVTFTGEELFHANKEVILSKQFYTNMTFALTISYPLKIQVLAPDTIFILNSYC